MVILYSFTNNYLNYYGNKLFLRLIHYLMNKSMILILKINILNLKNQNIQILL